MLVASLAGGVSAAYVMADCFARSGSHALCPPRKTAHSFPCRPGCGDISCRTSSRPTSTHLRAGEAKPGALLSPQGKILFDFLISRAGENAFRLECRAETADDFIRRLMLYRLRAKVEIAKADQALVGVAWGDDSAASQSKSTPAESAPVADRRFLDAAVDAPLRRHGRGRRSHCLASPAHRQRHCRKRRGLRSSAMRFRMTCCSTRPAASASRRAAISARRSCRACSTAARQAAGADRPGCTRLCPRPALSSRSAGGRSARLARPPATTGLAIARIDQRQGGARRRPADHWRARCR